MSADDNKSLENYPKCKALIMTLDNDKCDTGGQQKYSLRFINTRY